MEQRICADASHLQSKGYTRELFERVVHCWECSLNTPFLQRIYDGTIDHQRFCYYLIQDYHYLLEYAKVFAWGVCLGSNEAEMAFMAKSVTAILETELDIHRGYMSRCGVTDRMLQACKPHPHNRAYTNYMLEAVRNGTYDTVLMAILACSWSYGEWAQHLLNAAPHLRHHQLLSPWITEYASEAYAHSVVEQLNMIEERACLWTACQREEFAALFERCSWYEYDFWQMEPEDWSVMQR